SSKKYQGTGLGLALTKRIVEAQGGFVGVTSEPGRGSEFFAILPCTVPGAAVPVPSGSALEGPAVLVVEDDPGDRAWMVRLLKGEGYAVAEARSGAEALALAAERAFAAIL